ncbi:hypothetical protein ONE63_008975 [Megalurothrips usitatus]|uniref:N-myc downstream regulated n=1 Tax=Megalurothrips usitatus TaxID=439358 RepID=A0AAV7XJQ1_9NEOP|nr:hypothetical protein ONE63_008975 [Megalurothrips usitatus]
MAAETQRALLRRRSSVGGCTEIKNYIVSSERCGELHVHVQGEVSQQEKRACFLTVHDLGTNHRSFLDFVNSPCMQEIKDRSIFVHVDMPGHHDNADNLPDGFEYPSLDVIGEDLVTVLDFLHLKYVVLLGEGAGANVLARFGLKHPTRVLGMVLINCTGSAASVMENFKNKTVNWKSNDTVSSSAEHYLVFHKFGHSLRVQQVSHDSNSDKEKVVDEYIQRLHSTTINTKNLKQYVHAFMKRMDLPLSESKTDILLITGVLGAYASVVEKLHKELDKDKATLLKVERAGDVLSDSPAKVAQSILLFCKGLGLLTSVSLPGVDRQRTFSGSSGEGESLGRRRLSRGMSMEEYDKPNIRRLSLTCADPPPPVPVAGKAK